MMSLVHRLSRLPAVSAALFSLAAVLATDHPSPAGAQAASRVGYSQAWMRRGSDANLPEVVSRRSRLVVAYCGQCHSPPPPALYSGDEWRWMIVRMDMRAWAAQQPDIHIASNDELIEIAKYYGAFSGD